MGNIKPTMIKRFAMKLINEYKDKFASDFEHNKKALKEICKERGYLISVKVRNQVAGYITRILSREE